MAAIPVSVAEAVVAMLAAASLTPTFTPERSYADWELKLEEAGSLLVDVVAVSTEQKASLETRGSNHHLIPIDIAVRKKFAASDQDEDTGRITIATVDELVLLVQTIFELFMPQRLTDFPAAVWQDTRILVNPDRMQLREWKQFCGIVRVTFRVDP